MPTHTTSVRPPLSVVTFLLTLLLPFQTASAARDVRQELSPHGRFQMRIVEPSKGGGSPECHVSFVRHQGPSTPLFVVPGCIGDVPGMNIVGVVESLGEVRFPITQGAVSFHLFSIASARGGNATEAIDYWAVTITADGIWSQFLLSGEPTLARITGLEPPSLIIEEPATSTTIGQRLTVQFGRLSKVDLPKLPSWVVGRSERELIGTLSGGFGYTNLRPLLIEGPDRETIIDEDGRCKLPDVGEDWGRARLRASFTNWNDGRTVVRCLSVTRLRSQHR